VRGRDAVDWGSRFMANTLFANRDLFMGHVISPLPLTDSGKEKLFQEFQEHGYVARQEYIGITVMSSLAGGNVWGLFNEGNPDQPNQVKVVLLSHPSLTDEEYDSWVEVLSNWAAAFDLDTRGAISRKIRNLKAVDRGVSATELHKSIPASLLISFARTSDFVMVIDPKSDRKRRIYATRNIG
jgi:hypothetical protein